MNIVFHFFTSEQSNFSRIETIHLKAEGYCITIEKIKLIKS
jgi:hypothetical protein